MGHDHQTTTPLDCNATDSCCSPKRKTEEQQHNHDGHTHGDTQTSWRIFAPALLSFILLLTGLALDYYIAQTWFSGWLRFVWYAAAYLPVGLPVLRDAWFNIRKGDFFSEFFLMGIATIGAFAIGEYPEGVAVMLFYAVGELFQDLAVSNAKKNISALLDQRPDIVTVLLNGVPSVKKAETVTPGEVIQLKPGEKLGLDGELLSDSASFNTAALTGESKPDTKVKGDSVLAGMINLQTVAQVKVTTAYNASKLSKILELVQQASKEKAPTELFIRKFAKVYTPIVVFLAVGICILPYFFVSDYQFNTWLYRSLIFLVISCPCALVISIPLGYFGGIGAASRQGILFKGGNYLDALAKIQHVVTDKTGTMTEGVFAVQQVQLEPGYQEADILPLVNAIEQQSTHPIATAIQQYVGATQKQIVLHGVTEIAGHGLQAQVEGEELLVGNFKLMDRFSVRYPVDPSSLVFTTIAIALGGKFVGYISIADKIKEDAKAAVARLHKLGVKTTMLSGDKTSVVTYVARELDIDQAFGDLLPEDKVNRIKEIKATNQQVAFVGDGINDAPVVALSDVGIAMGGLGSDATIETADVVIQDDRPSKIATAIQIGKQTKRVVWQNIALAFIVKAAVLALGAWGVATMWEAVFADVGVSILAILNAVRIQRMKF